MLSALMFAVTIHDTNCSQFSNWCVLTVRNKTVYGKVDVQLHSLLTSMLDRCECPISRPGRFAQGKEHMYALDMRLGKLQSRSGLF